jgi:chromosome segregation and condensation protein ScpB
MSQVRPKGEKVGEIAAKSVVQLLFATGKSFTVDGLREKLREFFRQEVRAELRAVAALNSVELITALISFNWQLALVGLQLRILNGVVSLLTTEVHNKALAGYLSEQKLASGNLQMTTATLEVLACIAFKATPNLFGVRPLFAGRLCTPTFAGFTRAYASRTL